ncbi:dual specificity protein phosphatase 12 isoform X1 [Petaurus breviceps papuanus]|uniref:dual specificity protein phosphatase 12 isoform X1 n=1 Tax=Petaurus breviceps papuanus TaxID=3040969 RepID=UPI0036DA4130
MLGEPRVPSPYRNLHIYYRTPKGTGGNTDFHLKGRSVGGERCSQSRKSTKPFLEERSQAVTKATFSFPWELLDYADKRVCLRVQDHGCTGIFLILRCPAWVPQQIMSAQGSFMFDAFRGSCMLWVRCYWKIWQLKKTSHAGISRSVAVVTAYLMKTEQLPFEDAYGSLQTIKPEAKMNEGFEWQLKLYQAMGCEVDTSSAIYKQYRLQKVTEKYPELQNLPQEVFAIDPTLISQELKNEILYKCRKCRRSLFRSSSILDHSEGSGPAAFAHKKMTPLIINIGNEATCTSYFIEPVQWMESALLGVMDGQLLCPKCNAKLGSFNWYGEQCSCGRWMTPAFQIHKNRVDEMKMLPLLGSQARKT